MHRYISVFSGDEFGRPIKLLQVMWLVWKIFNQIVRLVAVKSEMKLQHDKYQPLYSVYKLLIKVHFLVCVNTICIGNLILIHMTHERCFSHGRLPFLMSWTVFAFLRLHWAILCYSHWISISKSVKHAARSSKYTHGTELLCVFFSVSPSLYQFHLGLFECSTSHQMQSNQCLWYAGSRQFRIPIKSNEEMEN